MNGNEMAFFREEQKFNQWWVQSIVLLVTAFMWYSAILQLLYRKTIGSNPPSDNGMIVMWIVFGIIFPVFMYSLRLVVEVRKDGLYIRFYPFHLSFKRTPFEKLKSYEARDYRPLRDYGGWGLRYGSRGKAYSTSGNRGVMLEYTDGGRLMLGSQKADDLALAIRNAMSMSN